MEPLRSHFYIEVNKMYEEQDKEISLCSEYCKRGNYLCCFDCSNTRGCDGICEEDGPKECNCRMGE